MPGAVTWRGYVRAGSLAKAEKVLGRVQAVLGDDAVAAGCERYWKDPGTYEITLTTPLAADRAPEIAASVLAAAQALAWRWIVGAPDYMDGGTTRFDGHASHRLRVPGLEWMAFDATWSPGRLTAGQ